MNQVQLVGRLTRDPELSGRDTAVCKFTLAIDRSPRRDGTKEADFPQVVVFGKQAEACAKYLAKGLQVCVMGRVQTGSYTKDNGDKVYTTDIVASHVEFIEWKKDDGPEWKQEQGGGYVDYY